MKRNSIEPRKNWPSTVESQGMPYHTADGVPYWDESVYYEFEAAEIDEIEKATYALNDLCLKAVEHVIENDRFDEMLIPKEYRDFIRRSWDRDEHTILGRFDFSYDGQSPPKLLEYNADTPTSLLEAAVIQWFWLKDVFPNRQQFNSIHERLIEAWTSVRKDVPDRMVFASQAESPEDFGNVNYLRDTAVQAGFDTAHLAVEDIGWNESLQAFVDLDDNPISWCFKLYPWEWMFHEDFGPKLLQDTCRWLEPPWKALLSNKAILPILFELFPESPYLLDSQFTRPADGNFVEKPIFGREGANVRFYKQGKLLFGTEGPYDGPTIFQEVWPLPRLDGKHFACIGSWIINGWSCGVGIREDENPVTGNLSRFVPHVF